MLHSRGAGRPADCFPSSAQDSGAPAVQRPFADSQSDDLKVHGMRAVQITRFGGPEVLDVVELPEPEPGPGQQLYDVSTAGLNFADTHQIENSYLAQQQLPLVP